MNKVEVSDYFVSQLINRCFLRGKKCEQYQHKIAGIFFDRQVDNQEVGGDCRKQKGLQHLKALEN